MDNIFKELEMMSLGESTVTETRKQLNKIVEIMTSLDYQEEMLTYFCEKVRDGIKLEVAKKLKLFYLAPGLGVNILPEDLRHDSLGFCKDSHFVYKERVVAPVMDIKGDTMGFVGYDKFEEPKYLDSINYGYVAKRTTFYGMERLPQAYKEGYIFFVEGPGCVWYMVGEGINCGATLGSGISEYVAQIARRFGRNAIFVPDADEAGEKFKKQIQYKCPQARIYQSRIAKDIDDSRKLKPDVGEDLKQLITNPFYRSKYFAKA